VLERGTPEEILLEQLLAREPTELESLARRTGQATETTRELVGALVRQGEIVALDGQKGALNPQTLIVSAPGWDRLVGRVTAALEAHHRSYPLRRGMPKEEVRTRLGVETRLFQRLVQRLLAEGRVAELGPLLSLAEHEVRFTPEQERQVEALLRLLREYGAAPPDRADWEAELRLSPELTQALLDQGRLVEVSAELLFPKDVYDDMLARVVEAIRQHGPITVAGVRDLFNTSRKFSLALMGHLDERKITRRIGDERVLY
jgi:selenocysteine-specific elongation factor